MYNTLKAVSKYPKIICLRTFMVGFCNIKYNVKKYVSTGESPVFVVKNTNCVFEPSIVRITDKKNYQSNG